MELRWLTAGDEAKVVLASHLFDNAVRLDRASEFLNRPGHHLCFAYDGEQEVGFVSGVETAHPDKGTEMFMYELGVDPGHRHRGVGSALVGALTQRSKALGCYGMWVLTDEDNIAAHRTYLAGGADDRPEPCVLFNWTFAGAGD